MSFCIMLLYLNKTTWRNITKTMGTVNILSYLKVNNIFIALSDKGNVNIYSSFNSLCYDDYIIQVVKCPRFSCRRLWAFSDIMTHKE